MAPFLLCVIAALAGGGGLVRLAQGQPVLPARPASRRRIGTQSPSGARGMSFALLASVVVAGLTRSPAAAVLAGALVVLWPKMARAGAIERASVAKVEAIATWTESLRDAAATESALESAIPATVSGAPALLAQPLRNLVNRLAVRVPLPEALTGFADEVNDPGADLVVAALSLNARQRAGSLKRVLTTLAINTRAELEVRRRVLNERNAVRRQSQQVALGIVALAGIQALFVPDWVAPYGTPLGQAVLAVLVAVYLVLTVRLQRLAAPEPQPRFLGSAEVVTELASWKPRAVTS